MDKSADQTYADLMRHLGGAAAAPEAIAGLFREVEQLHAQGRIADWQLQNAREAYASTDDRGRRGARLVGAVGSELGEAASRVVGKAKDALQSGAAHVGARATTLAETYTKKDPVRAWLIAAGVGALLMAVASMTARSGARALERKVRR